MIVCLLKDVEFEDLAGDKRILPKGLIVEIDDFDSQLLLFPEGVLEYIVKVEKADYRNFREMN